MPHVEADYHLPLQPGTNVAVLTALAHVIVAEGLVDEAFVRERCDWQEFQDWAEFVSEPRNSPEEVAKVSGVPADTIRKAARLYATGGNAAIYYGLGVTEHSQGSTTVLAIANLALATGNLGRRGVGVNPLRGQNNVQGACDMGSFPHEFSGYRHVSNDAVRSIFEKAWGVPLDNEPGLRIPNMFDAAVEGTFRGIYVQGEDILQSDPDTTHVARSLAAMECVVVQDLFLNETANYAHVFLPGCTFLEKDGTFTNAERRIGRVRKVMSPKNGFGDWDHGTIECHGLSNELHASKRDHGRDRGDDTDFCGGLLRQTRRSRLGPMALQCGGARRDADHAHRCLRAGKRQIRRHRICGDRRADRGALPASAHDRAHPQPL
jgi:formate dehydrogenase major subunit